MKKLSQKTNRLISILCLGVFSLSVFMMAFMGIKVYTSYLENQRLNQEYEQIKQEAQRIEEIYQKVDDDGYYNVYSNGEMIIYGDNEIIIIPK